MPRVVPPAKRDRYIALRQSGNSQAQAARDAGVSRTWAHTFEVGLSGDIRATFPRGLANNVATSVRERPIPRDELSEEAARALGDFEYFRVREFGRRSTPWQVEAGERLAELLRTDDKEFVVLNCPPGAGKSTLLRDIMMWLICQDRSVRMLLGSRTQRQATSYARVIKQALERRAPMQAKDAERRLGLSIDAETFPAADFGPFRPTAREEMWRAEQFTVVQSGETPTDEKESTVTAFGMDSGQLGWRVNGVFWDDLVDTSTVKTLNAIEAQQQWYEDEAETRLEPRGLLVLCGQRIASNDLYRHCLDMPGLSWVEMDYEGEDAEPTTKKYTHIVYKAHDETICEQKHRPSEAEPWPAGCLLDPIRIPWRELSPMTGHKERKFRVLYQQEDVDPAAVLVPKLWIDGGQDPATGEILPGCWDSERRIGELPTGLKPPLVSVAVADPSPTKFWAIEWIVYQPSTGLRFLMDLERRSMDAPEFLDWNEREQTFSGVMESWQQRSKGMGVPIQWWVIEQNCAQRFILQYDHFRRWQQRTGVRVIGHETHGGNKADPEFGLEASLKPIFRRGLLRLPGSQDGVTRTAALKLVDEATRYPDVSTDDTLMALWFFEFSKHRFEATPPERMPRREVPRFMKETAA